MDTRIYVTARVSRQHLKVKAGMGWLISGNHPSCQPLSRRSPHPPASDGGTDLITLSFILNKYSRPQHLLSHHNSPVSCGCVRSSKNTRNACWNKCCGIPEHSYLLQVLLLSEPLSCWSQTSQCQINQTNQLFNLNFGGQVHHKRG